MCQHEVISSFHLFREANSNLQIIKYFYQRHRLHRFEAGLYGAACFKIFQVTLNYDLVSFKIMPDVFVVTEFIDKNVTTRFNCKDMFRCCQHHLQLHNV